MFDFLSTLLNMTIKSRDPFLNEIRRCQRLVFGCIALSLVLIVLSDFVFPNSSTSGIFQTMISPIFTQISYYLAIGSIVFFAASIFNAIRLLFIFNNN
jgi:hypothetical protein